jgi:hypothetical protein
MAWYFDAAIGSAIRKHFHIGTNTGAALAIQPLHEQIAAPSISRLEQLSRALSWEQTCIAPIC